jgi:hypothetical protein
MNRNNLCGSAQKCGSVSGASGSVWQCAQPCVAVFSVVRVWQCARHNGSVRLSGSAVVRQCLQRACVRQCVEVRGSVCVAVQQCAAVRQYVAARAAVCGSACGHVWQCVAVSGSALLYVDTTYITQISKAVAYNIYMGMPL